MSIDSQGTPVAFPVKSAGATIYRNRVVYDDGSNTQPLSSTDQATTNSLNPLGVFYGNINGADAASGDVGLDVRKAGAENPVWMVAGTGGVTAGERWCSEYNGTAASAARALGVDTSNTPFHPGQKDCGEVLTTAAAGDLFLASFDPMTYSAPYIGSAVEIATAGAHTITAAQCLSIQIARDCAGAGRTDTTDTAANIIAEAAKYGYGVGDSWTLEIANTSDAAESITLAFGPGVTADNAGADLLIDQTARATLKFSISSASTVAVGVLKGPNA